MSPSTRGTCDSLSPTALPGLWCLMARDDHLLHVEFGIRGPEFRLECRHEVGEYPSLDEDGEFLSNQCWVPDWFDEQGMDDIALMGFPADPHFPIPVRPEFRDGLVLHYVHDPNAERGERGALR